MIGSRTEEELKEISSRYHPSPLGRCSHEGRYWNWCYSNLCPANPGYDVTHADGDHEWREKILLDCEWRIKNEDYITN